jgi:hypothetical protein
MSCIYISCPYRRKLAVGLVLSYFPCRGHGKGSSAGAQFPPASPPDVPEDKKFLYGRKRLEERVFLSRKLLVLSLLQP